MNNISDLNYFLKYIPYSNSSNCKLSDDFEKRLLQLGKKYPIIFIYDIEFQHLKNQTRHILEFGGIIFIFKNNLWSYHSNFHFNLPLVDNLNNMFILQSKYATVSPKTRVKMEEIEKKYLYYVDLDNNRENPNEFTFLYNKYINSKLAKKFKIKYYEPLPTNYKKIIRSFKDITFRLNNKDIGSNNFNKIWNLYLNDPWVKERTIVPHKQWLQSLRNILTNSMNIVKGNMDILAIDNLFKKHNINVITNKIGIYDIADYNDMFRKLCNSAELENTYWCLVEKTLIDPKIEKTIMLILKTLMVHGKQLSAHNPLIDTFFTMVVAISIVNTNKI